MEWLSPGHLIVGAGEGVVFSVGSRLRPPLLRRSIRGGAGAAVAVVILIVGVAVLIAWIVGLVPALGPAP
jgi:hypothetical protein